MTALNMFCWRISAFLLTAFVATTSAKTASTIEYKELSEALKKNSITLIDVRETSELANDGMILGSYNIPLNQIKSAFKLDKEEFLDQYGFELPKKDSKKIVLSCRTGARAQKAKKRMEGIGYKHVRVYKGGVDDFKANGGETVKGTKI